MKKKPNALLSVLKFARDYWPFIVLAGGFAITFYNLPSRVDAVEKKQSQVEKYIEAIEDQKRLMKKAPEGFIWDIKTEDYIPDPNYTPPKRKK